MKKIPLTQGKYAKVDDDDYPYLSRFSWHWDIDCVMTTFYDTKGKGRHIPMFRFIKTTDPAKFIFFKNGDNLDHRKENLSEQSRNLSTHKSKKKKGASSKYKGVCKIKRTGGYMAYITIKKGQRAYLGYFINEKEAGLAYNKKAIELYGENAYQNKIYED